MPNQDYPGVCMACTSEECKVVAPDVSAYVERVRDNPLTGYTVNLVNNLKFAMPDKFTNDVDAYMAVDVFKAVIAMGLKNKEAVDIHGLGTFQLEGGKVTFTPDPVLEPAVNE